MKSIITSIVIILFTCNLQAQYFNISEECRNGIDDDGDGLIDLNDDTECMCSFKTVTPIEIQTGCTPNGPYIIPPTDPYPVFGFCWPQEDYQWYTNGVAINPGFPNNTDTLTLLKYTYSVECANTCELTSYIPYCPTGLEEPDAPLKIVVKGNIISSKAKGQLYIYNITGQLIHQELMNGEGVTFDKRGTYFLRLTTTERVITKKIHIQQ